MLRVIYLKIRWQASAHHGRCSGYEAIRPKIMLVIFVSTFPYAKVQSMTWTAACIDCTHVTDVSVVGLSSISSMLRHVMTDVPPKLSRCLVIS